MKSPARSSQHLKGIRSSARVVAGENMNGHPPENDEQHLRELEEVREALRLSEDRNRAIVETAVNAIITINERGVIESVNSATVRMFGYVTEEMIGRNVSMLMPSPYREQHDGYLGNYLRTGERKIIGIGRETLAQRKDGTIFPMDLSVGEVKLPRGRIFAGIIRDITDRKELEQQILGISEEAQHRIGQDLHDDLCQQLAAIGCLAKVVLQRLESTRNGESANVAEIVKLISQANTRAREMSRGLVPVVLDSEGSWLRSMNWWPARSASSACPAVSAVIRPCISTKTRRPPSSTALPRRRWEMPSSTATPRGWRFSSRSRGACCN
nr:PAS domain S-box protein [Verrucomicrobium spinosum]